MINTIPAHTLCLGFGFVSAMSLNERLGPCYGDMSKHDFFVCVAVKKKRRQNNVCSTEEPLGTQASRDPTLLLYMYRCPVQ